MTNHETILANDMLRAAVFETEPSQSSLTDHPLFPNTPPRSVSETAAP